MEFGRATPSRIMTKGWNSQEFSDRKTGRDGDEESTRKDSLQLWNNVFMFQTRHCDFT